MMDAVFGRNGERFDTLVDETPNKDAFASDTANVKQLMAMQRRRRGGTI